MNIKSNTAFPKLTPEQIDMLRPFGRVRSVQVGDILFSEGNRDFAFFVVLTGAVEVLEGFPRDPHTVTVHEPGEFVGDVDLLTGRASLVTARVTMAGDVLELDTEALRKVVAELPDVSDVLLRAFMARRTLLAGEGYKGIKIIGSRYSPAAHHLSEFATRNNIPFTWIDLEQDEQAEQLLRRFGVTADATPIVIGRNGEWVSNPSVPDFARYMGFKMNEPPGEVHDLVVVGAGPAGLAAAVYAASEGLTTLVLDSVAAGGQAGTSSKIENYLGFPTGISGADLANRALLQAQKFGAVLSVPRTAVGLRLDDGYRIVTLDDGSEIKALAVLVASGVEYRRLNLDRLADFEGAGVYYAASEMEAQLCGGDEVVVVGGGNSAGQAAVFLSHSAHRVHLIIRGDDLGKSMSRYLVERVAHTGNIVVHHNTAVTALDGDGRLSSVTLRDTATNEQATVQARALFIFIGAVPHTEWLRDSVRLDRKGFVLTGPALGPEMLDTDLWRSAGRTPLFLETSLPGVFAAGDARSGSIKRVASAVGEGSMAVTFVHTEIGSLADRPTA
ncbi:MAG: FAD-dependent oxidoreductase [Gemmatimonadaceae bacterium]